VWAQGRITMLCLYQRTPARVRLGPEPVPNASGDPWHGQEGFLAPGLLPELLPAQLPAHSAWVEGGGALQLLPWSHASFKLRAKSSPGRCQRRHRPESDPGLFTSLAALQELGRLQ
jgi:hypothetical protein